MSFTNIPEWLTAMSINAKDATKMMLQPTGIRILKNTVPMTRKGVKIPSALRQVQKSIVSGEKKTYAEAKHILPWEGQYGLGIWFDNHASDAENKNLSLITKITTNLWKLCGCVSHATNKDIRN